MPEEGLVFSFLKSEKLGTDCARGFSNGALRLPEVELEALTEDLEPGATELRGVDEDKLRFGKGFFIWLLLETPSSGYASNSSSSL